MVKWLSLIFFNDKVILMSATLESQRFANYFSSVMTLPDGQKLKIPAPIIEVSSRPFTVDVSHLEKIKELHGFAEVCTGYINVLINLNCLKNFFFFFLVRFS